MERLPEGPQDRRAANAQIQGVLMKINRALTFILAIVAISVSPVNAAEPLMVPGDYLTIQAAIDAATPGQEIKVAAGNWAGAVVWQPVEIEGKGSDTRIVEGVTTFDDGFAIFADGTEISHVAVEGTAFGVFVEANNVKLSHMEFIGCVICVRSARSGLTVIHSEFEMRDEYDGLDYPTGIEIHSSNGLFAYNKFNFSHEGISGATAAIGLFSSGQPVANNVIEHNMIS